MHVLWIVWYAHCTPREPIFWGSTAQTTDGKIECGLPDSIKCSAPFVGATRGLNICKFHHHHQANIELGHFLTRSGFTGLEVSWMVSSSFFCLLIYSLLVFSEIYYGAFCFCIFHYCCNYSFWEKKKSHYCRNTPHYAGHLSQHSQEIKNYSHPNEGNY
jgi:hypothetical protein